MKTLKLSVRLGTVDKVVPRNSLPKELREKIERGPDGDAVQVLNEQGWNILTVVAIGEGNTDIWLTSTE